MTNSFDLVRRIAACPHLERCRSECNLISDPQPCIDYIGSRYRGLVIVGANPGIATNLSQKTNDAHMFALQKELAAGSREAFAALMAFLPKSMLGWRQMVNQRAKKYLAYDIEEIAYVNLVKCGTRETSSNVHGLFKGTAKDIPQRCWETHTEEILKFLKPEFVVALWKPVIPSLRKLGFAFDGVVKFGAYNGSHSVPFQGKFEEIKPIFDLYNGVVPGFPGAANEGRAGV